MPMLARIVMDVIHMPNKIPFIANAVFPVAALPNTPLALALPTCRNALPPWQCTRKASFDQSPAQGKVRIPGRQRAKGVEVIGQDHNGVDTPGMAAHHGS